MLNLTEQQKSALKNLMWLRFSARKVIAGQESNRCKQQLFERSYKAAIASGDRKVEALTKIDLEHLREKALEIEFLIIQIGQAFVPLAKFCDATLPRAVWLRALSVNESEWESEPMQKYGTNMRGVVCVLNLENSASRKEFDIGPLNWCCTMAMFNAMDTNPKFGEVIHDGLNEVFNGAFGDYREPSVLQRLGVKNATL